MPITYEAHFKRMYSDLVNLLRTLEEEIGRERLLEICRKWSKKRGVEMVRNHHVNSFSEFKESWKGANATEYYQHTTTTTYPEESDTVLQCKITECLWAKTFRDLDAAEVGKILACDPDFSMASAMNPKLKLVRDKTLMEGHDYCNHRYVWEE